MEKIAKNYDEFVDKVTTALMNTLNTETGQELTQQLLKLKLTENPDLTPEQWKDTKSQFMTYLFCMFVTDCPEAKQEIAEHVWNELNKEG